MGPVLDAMRFQPPLLGRGPHKPLEIAAWMQSLAAPVGGREQRRDDLVPLGRARLVVLVIEGMGYDFGAKVRAVFGEFSVWQRLGSAYQLAVNAAALAPLAGPVLHGLDLHVIPVLPKRRENAAVVRHVAIPVGSAFPDAHSGEVGRLQRSHVPLIDPIV